MSAMNVDSAFQSAAEQGRRPLSRADRNRILSARSARAYPYNIYGRQIYKRGTPQGLAKWGSSYRTATALQKQHRVNDGIIGSGAYGYGSFGTAGRMLGSRVGRYLGNKLGRTGLGDLGAAGQSLGALAGGMAGTALGMRITGRGAYATNSLFQGSMGVAQFAGSGDETGALHINHTEYVQDVLGTSEFTNNAYPINPGDPALFPWLSQIACNYDEYEFSGLVFHYRSVTGDVVTSTSQLGTVILVTNYNSGAAPFTSKQSMMDYDGASRVKISEDLISGVECDRSKLSMGGSLFVALNGTVPPGQDLKTYYHGLFQIATNACSSTGQIGELWVSYKVTLRKPKAAVSIGAQIPTSVLNISTNSTVCNAANGAPLTPSVDTLFTVNSQFNNLEDCSYAGGIFPFSQQVTQRGLYNTVFVTASSSISRIGWQVSCTGTRVGAIFVLPTWLQSGTYKYSVTITGFGWGTITSISAGDGTGLTGLSTVSTVTVGQSFAGAGFFQPIILAGSFNVLKSQQSTGVAQSIFHEINGTGFTYATDGSISGGVSGFCNIQCELLQVNAAIAPLNPAPLA